MIKRPKGFSLLEVLVAFSIMAVAITIVLRIFGSGVNNAEVSEEYNIAVQIAESILARTGIVTPLSEGEISGIEGNKYHWLVTVAIVNQMQNSHNPVTQQLQQTQQTTPTTLYRIRVLVVWGDEQYPRQLELQSLKSV